ncbi:uncharacterized protein BYT42DRAFT_392146 [Radiomyces spectabilis]|uniref:uncharacterized protein n=1 Tax=Radiomyces spectabilis TaxID=64574 RepID=UPI0022201019|nr:uncharacterized protein BYT42DRAFT_392146 [Radiomyces spectabilis]KAI8374127.1 hypothetical protein BYT42DRAFT_392146 [Radiomyces spectabilis]
MYSLYINQCNRTLANNIVTPQGTCPLCEATLLIRSFFYVAMNIRGYTNYADWPGIDAGPPPHTSSPNFPAAYAV